MKASLVRNQKGSALLAIVGMSVVVAIAFSQLFGSVIDMKKLNKRVSASIDEDIAMNSVLDYTINGIRQRWCFSDSWLRQEPCELTHGRNIERMLLTSESINAIQSLKAAGAAIAVGNPITINNITTTIAVKSFSQKHPLRDVIDSISAKGVESLKISIQKLENANVRSISQETMLRVRVELITGKRSAVLDSRNLVMESVIGIYPLEVGTFALHLADDLYLGTGSSAGLGDSMLESGTRSAKGIYFESPVFVNGSIYVPKTGDPTYVPVTFGGDVYLGNGVLKQGGSGYVPPDLGGKGSRYYSEMTSFGGFKKGMTFLGDRDLGLDVLSGKMAGSAPGSPGTKTLMEQCIDRNLALSDLRKTNRSHLVARVLDAQPNNYTLNLGLTQLNRYITQRDVKKGIDDADGVFYGGSSGATYSASKGNPVFKVTISTGKGHVVVAEMQKNSSVTIKPQFLNEKAINDAVTDTKKAYDSANGKVDDKKDDIKDIEKNIVNKEKEIKKLEDENKSTTAAKNALNNLKKQLADAKEDLKDLEEISANKRVAWEGAVAAKNDFDNSKATPPEMTVSLKTTAMSSTDQFNQMTLDVVFKNSRWFDGNARVDFVAYDIGTEKGEDIRKKWSSCGSDIDVKTCVPGYDRNGTLSFKPVSDNMEMESPYNTDYAIMNEANRNNPVVEPIETEYDYGALDKRCNDPKSGVSFETADWNHSFAPSSHHSWNFADPFSGVWEATAAANNTFHVRSIVNHCKISADVTLLTGYFNCLIFEIMPRAKPLKIIGTVITTKLVVHRSAYDAGIWWSSVYSPNAVRELRAVNPPILKAIGAGVCDSVQEPVWHPHPSMHILASNYRCNSIYLRDKANPFTWTTVDPDCGIVNASVDSNVKCKKHIRRFKVKEVGRTSSI